MGYMGFAPDPGAIGEFTIGSADIDARAQGVASAGKGSVLRGFVVLSGTGALVYVDDRKGDVCTMTGLVAGSDVESDGGLSIRSINGTGNSAPSAALVLRGVW